MNHYRCSDGTKISKSLLDKRIHDAKFKKLAQFIEDNGYIFCEDCRLNNCTPVDCSHDISVDECQKSGRSELACDVNNITLRGRKCHVIWDNKTRKAEN